MAVVADREVLRLLGVVDLPDLPAGFEARFARWGTGADGETLRYDSSLPEIFASHRNVLVRATGSLDAAGLESRWTRRTTLMRKRSSSSERSAR
jgi:hypothetical protein